MKNIDASIEWYRSNQGHCDALIKDIVLGNKGDGEHKEERSHQEDRFIDDLENLRGYVDRLEKRKLSLPSKLQETTRVLEILSNWGLENNDNIIQVIKKIKKSLEEQARVVKEEDIKPSLELLEKQVIGKNTTVVIDFKQIKGILIAKVNGDTNNENELSISLEKDQTSVFENKYLRCLIAEFLDDVRDKLRFLFSLSKPLSKDSKITGNLNLSPYRFVIESEVFQTLMDKTVGLKEVSLKACDKLTNEDISEIIQKKTSLTRLNLRETNITDKGLKELAKHCSNLTSLDLSYCDKITDDGVKALAPSLGNLTSLDLRSTNIIEDEGLKLLTKSCSNLTRLNINWCCEFTAEGIVAVAPYLCNQTDLDLGKKITDDGLVALVPHLGDLTDLQFYEAKITDEGLMAVAPALRNLIRLEFYGCENITGEGLVTLAENCKNLIHLSLEYCENITDEGLRELAPYLGRLYSFNLSDCSRTTDEGLKSIVKRNPELESVTKGLEQPMFWHEDWNIINRLRSEIEKEDRDNSFSF